MAKKLKEQIDYGNTPERMDPSLERKLASPENLYASQPNLMPSYHRNHLDVNFHPFDKCLTSKDNPGGLTSGQGTRDGKRPRLTSRTAAGRSAPLPPSAPPSRAAPLGAIRSAPSACTRGQRASRSSA